MHSPHPPFRRAGNRPTLVTGTPTLRLGAVPAQRRYIAGCLTTQQLAAGLSQFGGIVAMRQMPC